MGGLIEMYQDLNSLKKLIIEKKKELDRRQLGGDDQNPDNTKFNQLVDKIEQEINSLKKSIIEKKKELYPRQLDGDDQNSDEIWDEIQLDGDDQNSDEIWDELIFSVFKYYSYKNPDNTNVNQLFDEFQQEINSLKKLIIDKLKIYTKKKVDRKLQLVIHKQEQQLVRYQQLNEDDKKSDEIWDREVRLSLSLYVSKSLDKNCKNPDNTNVNQLFDEFRQEITCLKKLIIYFKKELDQIQLDGDDQNSDEIRWDEIQLDGDDENSNVNQLYQLFFIFEQEINYFQKLLGDDQNLNVNQLYQLVSKLEEEINDFQKLIIDKKKELDRRQLDGNDQKPPYKELDPIQMQIKDRIEWVVKEFGRGLILISPNQFFGDPIEWDHWDDPLVQKYQDLRQLYQDLRQTYQALNSLEKLIIDFQKELNRRQMKIKKRIERSVKELNRNLDFMGENKVYVDPIGWDDLEDESFEENQNHDELGQMYQVLNSFKKSIIDKKKKLDRSPMEFFKRVERLLDRRSIGIFKRIERLVHRVTWNLNLMDENEVSVYPIEVYDWYDLEEGLFEENQYYKELIQMSQHLSSLEKLIIDFQKDRRQLDGDDQNSKGDERQLDGDDQNSKGDERQLDGDDQNSDEKGDERFCKLCYDDLIVKNEKPYLDRMDSYQKETGLKEAVQTGTGQIKGITVAIGFMEFEFLGGSMGSAVGIRINRLIQYAIKQSLPLIIVCASGGARMQEGSLSLMQMAKISSTLLDYKSNKKSFYTSILTSPTTGGVTASFGMLGDIVIAEPHAYIAFAGKRVIEETLKIEVPEGTQETEYLFDKGLFDLVVPRNLLKDVLSQLLKKLYALLSLTSNEIEIK